MAKGEIISYFASQLRAGLEGADIARVHENLHKGIWPQNGHFNLVDSWSIAAPKGRTSADDFAVVPGEEPPRGDGVFSRDCCAPLQGTRRAFAGCGL
jgi:hypothetical protein